MRTLNLHNRLQLLIGGGVIDVETASAARFGSDPQEIFKSWPEFVGWAAEFDGKNVTQPFDPTDVGAPVPRPRQVFAVGLNYLAHADESGFALPEEPVIFTKFASSLTGPITTVVLPDGHVDWEVELVVVVGSGGRDIRQEDAWSRVAGVTVGQDLSERRGQHSGPAPQFSLAKSHRGFSPTGPALVTIDELGDPDDLELGADIDGENVQKGSTSQLIFSVPDLIHRLSRIVELYPGDLIFTGTPSGVGAGRTPPRFLEHGEVLHSYITGVGELRQTFVSSTPQPA